MPTCTHALSAGMDTKVVQDLLCTLTRDTYMSVDDVKRAAAEAICDRPAILAHADETATAGPPR